MNTEETLRKLRALEWTEELRPGHPWRGDILIRKKDVEALIAGKPVERAPTIFETKGT